MIYVPRVEITQGARCIWVPSFVFIVDSTFFEKYSTTRHLWVRFVLPDVCLALKPLCARGIYHIEAGQNGHLFPDDIFKCIFLNENIKIVIKISLQFVSNGPINDIPALVQIMAWRRPGDKPLSEPMVVSLPTHICVNRPQWDHLDNRDGIMSIFTESLLTSSSCFRDHHDSIVRVRGVSSTYWCGCGRINNILKTIFII